MGKRNCFFNPNFQIIAKKLQNNNKVIVGKDRQEKKVSSNHMCLVSAKIPARTEPPGLFRTDGKRPDGMTQLAWKKGKNLVWDVTIADSVCATYVSKCAKVPGAAAESRESAKITKYKNLEQDYYFVPIAIESFGSWGREGHKLIKEIGAKMKEVTGEQRSTFYLTQRISMAVQRGNSSCVLGTIPSTDGLDEIFEFIAE